MAASASAAQPARRVEGFGRLWWLPAGGEGNGLDDTAWAPLAVGKAPVMRALLTELRRGGVPAYAAPVTRRPTRRAWQTSASATTTAAARGGKPDSTERYQLWVGTSRYSRAEEILRVRLPALLQACPSARRRLPGPADGTHPDGHTATIR